MNNKITKIIITLAIFLPSLVLAVNTPRIYIAGYAGTDSNLLGKADVLVPIYLTMDKNLFIYAQGKYAHEDKSWEDNTYTGSLGVGFRQIVKDTAVLGVYTFGDYTNSTSGHTFWVISPGIESLSRAWDIRVNGYFPLDKKEWIDAAWASEFGYYHHIRFEGNSQYDHWYEYYQETGPGADTEVGRNLFKIKKILFKGYINGYYYNMKHNDDVIGAGARLTMQPNQTLKISLRYSYDNYEHSTFMAGVQLSFYNLISDDRNLQRNLFVPIERNLATIGTGSSIPIVESDKPKDVGERLMLDNIWFFKSGVASNTVQGNGTYEHPFIDFTTEEVEYVKANYPNIGATIDPFPLLYFNSGTYPLTDFSNNRFAVPAGWGMYGWDGTTPAKETRRPIFIGGINLLQGSNTLDSIAIHKNSGFQPDGLYITANNIYLNNIEVGALNNSIGYKTGIAIDHARNITLNQSQIYGFNVSTTSNVYAYGIDAETGSELEIGNNNTVSAIAIASGSDAVATGIYVIDYNTSFILSGSRNNISALATASGHDAYAQGIQSWFGSKTTLNGNGNNISATANGSRYAYAQGIDVMDNGTSFILSGNSNNISASATTSESHYADAEGIRSWDGSQTTISGRGNNILATAGGNYANATGIDVGYNNTLFTLSGNGNNIYANATAANIVGKAYGIYVGHGSPTLNILDSATNTTIVVNGRSSSWGIYAAQHAVLQRENSPITNAYAYDDLITYTNLNPKSHGNALQWDTMIRPW